MLVYRRWITKDRFHGVPEYPQTIVLGNGWYEDTLSTRHHTLAELLQALRYFTPQLYREWRVLDPVTHAVLRTKPRKEMPGTADNVPVIFFPEERLQIDAAIMAGEIDPREEEDEQEWATDDWDGVDDEDEDE